MARQRQLGSERNREGEDEREDKRGLGFVYLVGGLLIHLQGTPDDRHGDNWRRGRRACVHSTMASSTLYRGGRKSLCGLGQNTIAT